MSQKPTSGRYRSGSSFGLVVSDSQPGDEEPDRRGGERLVQRLVAEHGASVANLYYAQPLLGLIRHSFGISSGTAALVVTLTQVGYALGLALLLPLGDLLENRKLASRTLVVTAVLLDFAVQGNQVLSLRDIYALCPQARARRTRCT